MELRSVAALIEASRKMPIWEAILCSDLEEDTPEQRAASLEKMRMLWQVMQDSAAGYDGSQRSLSGLSGGDGETGGLIPAELHAEANAIGPDAIRRMNSEYFEHTKGNFGKPYDVSDYQ